MSNHKPYYHSFLYSVKTDITFRILFILLIGTAAGMFFINTSFEFSPFIGSPQGFFNPFAWELLPIGSELKTEAGGFFILDYFFPIALAGVCFMIFKGFLLVHFPPALPNENQESQGTNAISSLDIESTKTFYLNRKNFWNSKNYRSTIRIFLLICIAAVIFDFIENSTFCKHLDLLFSNPGDFPEGVTWMVGIKKLAYSLMIIGTLFVVVFRLISDFKQILIENINEIFLSVLTIGVILLLLTKMDQGLIFFLDLFDHPINIAIFYLLFFIQLILIWHVPRYYTAKIEGLDNKNFLGNLIGLFGTKSIEFENNSDGRRELAVLRRLLGLVFVLSFVYIAALLQEKYSIKHWRSAVVFLIVLVLYGIYYRKSEDICRNKAAKQHWTYLVGIGAGIFVLFSLFGVFVKYMNGQWQLIFFLINIILLGILFIWIAIFRNVRANVAASFKYVEKGMKLFGPESLHVILIIALPLIFIAYLILLFVPSWYTFVNPINIVLGVLILIHGIVSIFKILATNNKELYLVYYSLLLVGGIAIWWVNSKYENHFHDLTLIEKEISDRSNAQDSLFQLSQKPGTLFVVAAEGGGLKAAYWNMQVMNYLDKKSNGSFYKRIYSISTVSGGSIGQGLYAILKDKYPNKPKEIEDAIEKIGAHNFISTDIGMILGRAPLFSIIPLDYEENLDRTEMMWRKYLSLAGYDDSGINELANKPYRSFWKGKKNFPYLLINTANTELGKKGVAFPKPWSQERFPGAISILDMYDEKTISLPDAIFTSNRFPGLSPLARIEGKGHFADGGTYENTGMQSTFEIIHDLKCNYNLSNHKIVFISIRNNSRRFILENFPYSSNKDINQSFTFPEFVGITDVMTAPALTGLPDAMHESALKAKESGYIDDYILINLPSIVDIDEVHGAYAGQIVDILPTKIDLLNDQVKTTLSDWNEAHGFDNSLIVEPPLGRLLSTEGANYIKAMLHYPSNQEAFKRIETHMK